MSQFIRLLLLSPTVFAPVLSLAIAAKPAPANTVWVPVTPDYACVRTPTREPKQLVCKRVSAGASETGQVIDLTKASGATTSVDIDGVNGELPDSFEMTIEESDASVALFGCDCPACVRSLRQLRTMMS